MTGSRDKALKTHPRGSYQTRCDCLRCDVHEHDTTKQDIAEAWNSSGDRSHIPYVRRVLYDMWPDLAVLLDGLVNNE